MPRRGRDHFAFAFITFGQSRIDFEIGVTSWEMVVCSFWSCSEQLLLLSQYKLALSTDHLDHSLVGNLDRTAIR